MRTFADKSYGIPPWRVIGSAGVTSLQTWDSSPVLIKMPKVLFVDDGPGKAEGIDHYIGRRPIFAFGNSNGDKEMLEWTAAGDGLRFMGLVYHTDAAREYAYGPAGGLPDSKVGTFPQSLMDEATGKGWAIADMKTNWKTIFPPAKD